MNRISTEEPTAPPALVETLRGHLGRRVAAEVLALVLAVLALASVWAMLRPLALLLAGGIIAAGVAPIVQRLERRLPRVAAVLLVYLAFLVLAGGLVALAVPTLTAQSRSLLTGSPALIDRAQQWLQQRGPAPLLPDQAAAALSSTIDRLSSALIALPLAVVSAATEALVVAVMSIYWLLAAPSLHRFLLSLLRARARHVADDLVQEICWTMGGYVRGIVVDMALLAIVVYAGLSLLGVPYALVLSLLSGLGAAIPIVGPILTALPAIAIAFTNSPLKALLVLILYLVVHHLESDLLLPNLVRNQADIPPLLVLFALLAGGATGSILAILIAVPVAGSLRIIVLRVVAPMLREWLGAAEEGRS